MKPRWPPIEGLFFSFYTFLKSFISKYTQNISLKDRNEFKTFKYISTKSNQVTGYIFTKINYQTNKKPDKTASKNYFKKLLSARPIFTVSSPSSDNLAHLLGHTAIMNPFKYLIMYSKIGPVTFHLRTFSMVGNVFEAEPNKN